MKSEIDKFVDDQLSVWPEAAARFRALRQVHTRKLTVRGLGVQLQYNPGRIHSSAARTDAASLAARPCFLCPQNRPAAQRCLKFEGRKGRKYDILVNPYPIFPRHLVIAQEGHEPQSIWNRLVDLADLAHHYTDFTFFYNGPHCGASAPDHLHFQAAPRGLMPLEREVDSLLDAVAREHADTGVPNGEEPGRVPPSLADDLSFITAVQEAQLFHYTHFTRGVFALRARTSKSLAKLFYRLLDCVDVVPGDQEPRINLLLWYRPLPDRHSGAVPQRRPSGNTHGLASFEYRAVVILRSRHRSRHYTAEGADHLTMSPGCADMAGLFIVPDPQDYAKLDVRLLTEMLDEVSVPAEVERDVLWRLRRTQPRLEVGILSGDEIVFEIISDGAGPQRVRYREGKIDYGGMLYDELYFEARTLSTVFAEPTFILHDVTIGVDFHWERKMTQRFAGALKFLVDGGKVVAVNVIGVEDYLLSVISSEMRPTAGLEFLKAHAVISRSWVMARLAGRGRRTVPDPETLEALSTPPSLLTWLDGRQAGAGPEETPEIVKWFDTGDHRKFDVCADDHCQRYQGLTEAVGATAREAVDRTWGEVLTYEGRLCDTRFSKCCGGRTEVFSTCWGDEDHPYLPSLPDTPGHDPDGDPFCHTDDAGVLSRVLNDYDLETKDFYAWEVRYSVGELSDLVARRSGRDIGLVRDLVPLGRGPSGRIKRLEVIGEKGSFIVGKELMIRRILFPTHLKSACFDVLRPDDGHFLLRGRGWGHGVGLCQIGAAVMDARGYGYRAILEHYYPSAEISRLEGLTPESPA